MANLLLTAVLAASAAIAPMAVQQSSAPGEMVWSSIVAGDGGAIGYGSEQVLPHGQGREIISYQEVSVAEGVGPSILISQRTERIEDRSGDTLAITSLTRTGKDWVRSEARIRAEGLEVVRQTALDRRTTLVALPSKVRFDDGEGVLKGWTPSANPSITFDAFDLDAAAVERVVVEALPSQAGDPPGHFRALRRRYDGVSLIGVASLTLDQNGQILETSQPMFGERILVRATDRETALRPHPPMHVLSHVMAKSPFRIPSSAANGHIRYRFTFKDGVSFTPPETGEQRASVGADGVEVDICETCGPGLPSDAASLADALRPTAWMQSDHPRLKAIAAPVARLRLSDRRKMELLLEKARPYLDHIDFAGHYSALETLSRRSGDCTEAAVLLAALGRAAGIPTRVANGLVYSQERYHGVSNVFMPHSWTLAWVDGRWRSFDLALDTFDATHIALTVGDGDARSVSAAGQLASLLRWDSVVEVRARAAG